MRSKYSGEASSAPNPVEEEYIKYFVENTKKDVMKIQELIDEEKENISNGLFVKMNELLKKIYESY